MSLFRNKSNLINVKLFYREENISGYDKIFIISKDEVNKLTEEEIKEKGIETLNTFWKSLSWQERNNINHESEVRGEGMVLGQVDYNRWRDLRVKQCLREWDVKDEEGNPVPCNPDTINRIDAYVLDAILDEFEKITSIELEEEIKK